jgi:hypothetical protein
MFSSAARGLQILVPEGRTDMYDFFDYRISGAVRDGTVGYFTP